MLRLMAAVVALIVWRVALYRKRSHARHPRLRAAPADAGSAAPLVSVIVPARDEEATVLACVRSLLAQDYPALEIIAIDDRSSDRTGALLEALASTDGRLSVVRGEDLPAGWMGKAHAIVQGYRAARGEWLLFTDADTVHAPWLLSSVMARVGASSASFATVFGEQRHPGPLVALMNLGVLVYLFLYVDFGRILDPASPHSLVNGQYVLFTREAYEAVGTHHALRKFSSTDVSLGYLAKLQGWIPLVLDGRDGLQTTMYSTAIDAFAGWSRSIVNGVWTASGRRRGSAALGVAVAAMAVVWIAPWIAIGRAIVMADAVALTFGFLSVIAGLLLMHLRERSVLGSRQPRAWKTIGATLLMPIAGAIFCVMAASGLARAFLRGGTEWRGRLVRTTRRLPPWRPQPPRTRT